MSLSCRNIVWIVGAWLLATVVFSITESELGLSLVGISFLFLVLPVLIARFLDWTGSRPVAEGNSAGTRFGRLVCALPALLFGLTSIAIGVAIVGWVLYNHFVERQPDYTGGALWITFGIGPMAVAFGGSVIRSSMQRAPEVIGEPGDRFEYDDGGAFDVVAGAVPGDSVT